MKWLLISILTVAGFALERELPADRPTFQVEDKDLPHPLSIITYGDMRFTDPGETHATNPTVRRWLVDKIAAENPAAVLLSGDVPWHGGVANDYAVYQTETRVWRQAHLRIFPALGNHELNSSDKQACIENWWTAFPELRDYRWYSVQLGAAVYVLNLDSNSPLVPGSAQQVWVDIQLHHLPPTIRFVFLNLHHPPVADYQPNGDPSHNPRPNEQALAAYLAQSPIHKTSKVIVVAGHVHNYERAVQDNTVYLVSGGGGADPRLIDRTPQDLYHGPSAPNYHYVKFVLNGNTLEATMTRVVDPTASSPAWAVADRFSIQ